MKKGSILWMSAAAALAVVSCGGGGDKSAAGMTVPSEIEVSGVTLKMCDVPPASFAMGLASSGVKASGATIHQVVLKGYSISEEPVSQELWTAVMGDNPSAVKSPSAPVDMVAYKDCIKFVKKISKLTGIPFALPTEAQWENYCIASNTAGKTPKYNEWCADSFQDDCGKTLVEDPLIVNKTPLKVARNHKAREAVEEYKKVPGLTFRLAVNTEVPVPEDIRNAFITAELSRENVSGGEVITVGKVKFRMIGVKGGIFDMGGTKEQGRSPSDDEKPVHAVTLQGFEIGQTEVTAGLWLEVMGKLPYKNSEKELSLPVVNVSWYDCQNFILALNRKTGRKFRLPTEAEWEFAARGGVRSAHTPVSGSVYPRFVAAFVETAKSEVQPVMSFAPNELGIYDMSGNAWEWCQDSYAPYPSEDQTDPYVNLPGANKVMRGGSAASRWDACRVSNRSSIPAGTIKATFGLRLAL